MVPVSAAAAALIVWSILPARNATQTSRLAKSAAAVEGAATPPATARNEAVAAPTVRPLTPEIKEEQAQRQTLRDAGDTKLGRSPGKSLGGSLGKSLGKSIASPADRRGEDAAKDQVPIDAAAKREALVAQTKADADEQSRANAAAAKAFVAPPQPPAPAAAPQRAESRLMSARVDAVSGATIVSTSPLSRWRTVPGGAVDRSTDGGSTWQRQQTGVTSTLTAGASPSPLVCWLVGQRGIVLLSTDGTAWMRVAFPEPIDLVSVRATDARTATVTASDGRAFDTTDGGTTWKAR